MGSNSHEMLVIAWSEIDEALKEERQTSASESIIEHAVKARQELLRLIEIQASILGRREQREVVFPIGSDPRDELLERLRHRALSADLNKQGITASLHREAIAEIERLRGVSDGA